METAGSSLNYMVRTRAVKSRSLGRFESIYVAYLSAARTSAGPARFRHGIRGCAFLERANGGRRRLRRRLAYRVYRAEIEPVEKSAPQDISQVKLKSPLAMQGSPSSAEFSDSHFEFGHTYLYTVRAVAQYGADTVESADSSPAVVTPRDTFPPATPVGLEAAMIPATPEAPAHVELSWAISSEGDLAGYHVYRSDLDEHTGRTHQQ